MDSSIYFVKLPSPQRLCHVTLQVACANYVHMQVLKCRQLLFFCPNAIAAPQTVDRMLIDVVLEVEFYKKKFAAYCNKFALKPVHAATTKNFVVERCVLYTLKFRLAPLWNQVGSVMVNNADFLQHHGKMEAVNLEVTVRDEEMVLKIKPYLIRLPPPKLESFGICPEALERFYEDPNYSIPECAINLQWCHILPTMNRGQLVNISHRMPLDGSSDKLLKDYTGLRKYWKNQYGYCLPESSEDVIYCSMLFKNLSSNYFTYPLICLRSRPVQFMPRCDGISILQRFIGNVQQKLTTLCGFSLTYSAKACKQVTSLTSSSEVKVGIPQNVISTEHKKSSSFTILDRSYDASRNVPVNDVISTTQGPGIRQDVSVNKVPQLKTNGEAKKKFSLTKFPTTADGKYIPVFKSRKTLQSNARNSVRNCESASDKRPAKASSDGFISKKFLTKTGTNGKKTFTQTTSTLSRHSFNTKQKQDSENNCSNPTLNHKPHSTEKLKLFSNHRHQKLPFQSSTPAQSAHSLVKCNFDHIFSSANSSLKAGLVSATGEALQMKSNDALVQKKRLVDGRFASTASSVAKRSRIGPQLPNQIAAGNASSSNNPTASKLSVFTTQGKHKFDELFVPASSRPENSVVTTANNATARLYPRKSVESRSTKFTLPSKKRGPNFDNLFSSASSISSTNQSI